VTIVDTDAEGLYAGSDTFGVSAVHLWNDVYGNLGEEDASCGGGPLYQNAVSGVGEASPAARFLRITRDDDAVRTHVVPAGTGLRGYGFAYGVEMDRCATVDLLTMSGDVLASEEVCMPELCLGMPAGEGVQASDVEAVLAAVNPCGIPDDVVEPPVEEPEDEWEWREHRHEAWEETDKSGSFRAGGGDCAERSKGGSGDAGRGGACSRCWAAGALGNWARCAWSPARGAHE